MNNTCFLQWTILTLTFIGIVSELYRLNQKSNNLRCEICRWKLKKEVTKGRDELATALAFSRQSGKDGGK